MIRDTPMSRATHCVFIRREGAAVGDAMNLAVLPSSAGSQARTEVGMRVCTAGTTPAYQDMQHVRSHSMAGNIKVQNRFLWVGVHEVPRTRTRIKCDEARPV
jgi:hypothetical protein